MNGIFLSKKLHRFAEDIMGLPRMQVYVLAVNTPHSCIYGKSTLQVVSYIVALRFRSFGKLIWNFIYSWQTNHCIERGDANQRLTLNYPYYISSLRSSTNLAMCRGVTVWNLNTSVCHRFMHIAHDSYMLKVSSLPVWDIGYIWTRMSSHLVLSVVYVRICQTSSLTIHKHCHCRNYAWLMHVIAYVNDLLMAYFLAIIINKHNNSSQSALLVIIYKTSCFINILVSERCISYCFTTAVFSNAIYYIL